MKNVLFSSLLAYVREKRGGVRLVIAALETSPCLRRLSMAGCQLGVDGGQAIIAAIGSDREQFRLLDLDLANNSLGAGCGGLLGVALRRNETLTRLSLRCARSAFAERSTDRHRQIPGDGWCIVDASGVIW